MKKPEEIEVRYYEDEFSRKPFAKFFNRLDAMAAVKVTAGDHTIEGRQQG